MRESARDTLNTDICLVEKYVEIVNLPEKPDAIPKQFPSIDDLLLHVQELARKPRIGVVGRFDSGKSRLINTLVGQEILPTGYQPETSLICLVRHTSDRPDWMKENPEAMEQNVFAMKEEARVESGCKRFDFDDFEDEENFQSFCCMSGGLDILKDIGSHSGGRAGDAVSQDMFAALVFVDAPILMNCDILDFPGYSNSEDDSQKAEFAKNRRLLDILVYTSTPIGFMDTSDFIFLKEHLVKLKPIVPEGVGPLQNLFVVATRSSIVDSAELAEILDKGGARTYDMLRDNLSNMLEGGVSQDTFRDRFFTFDAEQIAHRRDFEKGLSELIEIRFPSLQRSRVDRAIIEAKGKTIAKFVSYSDYISGILNDVESKAKELQDLETSEADRKAERDRMAERIRLKILKSNEETKTFITTDLKEQCSEQAIEGLIRDKGYNKKEAKQECGVYLINILQTSLGKFLSAKARELANDIDLYHEAFGHNEGAFSGDFLFDSRAAFIGGLAGVTAFGALSVWATTVAAGSNLGAYILTAKIVSVLGSMGISVGGVAAANAAIAVIGGPVTIMISLAICVAMLAWVISGRPWQKRLASKLAKLVSKECIIKKLSDSAEDYWDSTRKAFDVAFDATENEYREHIDTLRGQIRELDRQSLNEQKKYIVAVRRLFEGLPWPKYRGQGWIWLH